MKPSVRFAIFSAILLAASAAAAADAVAVAEIEKDNELSTALATPHKAWARGAAAGALRALFVVNVGSQEESSWYFPTTHVREVVELAERMDLKADAILAGLAGGSWTFHGQAAGRRRADRLAAQPYDLFVLAGVPLDKLPGRFQLLVMKQVARGAGLLCCGPGCEYLAAKRRIELPPALAGGLPTLDGQPARQRLFAYRLGKGRGVWLNWPVNSLTPPHDFTWRGLNEYDYWMLPVVRAALWAGSREGNVRLVSMLDDKPLRVDREAASTTTIVLSNSGSQPATVKVALELRRAADGWRRSLGQPAATLSPGQTLALPLALPRCRVGDYFLDAVVRSDRGVETCGAGSLTFTSDAGVERVELDRAFVERGETIAAKISLRGQPPDGSALRLQLRDSDDRVLAREDFALAPGRREYAFQRRAEAAWTILMRLEAILRCDGEEIDCREASFTVPNRRRGRFNFVMWEAPSDVLGYYAERHLREAGYNVALMGSMGGLTPQPPLTRACNVSLVPYSTRILDPKDARGYMQPICWNDERAATQYVEKIAANQRLLREQGVYVYSLGDEGVTLGCCVHPACIAAYRRWLAGQYGEIQRLNASWGSHYKSFDEVDLLDHKDNMELAAMKTAPARACDREAFARTNLARFTKRFGDAYRRLDPYAATGFEGTGGFGDDYDAILAANGFYGPYPSVGNEIVRSAAPADEATSNWIGYSKTGDQLSDAGWRAVMEGMNNVYFWTWSGIGAFHGYISPTLDFWPATADLTEEMRPLREGLGDLLRQSQKSDSGIAIFYSVPSAFASRLPQGSQFGAAAKSHELWVRLIHELGFDFRYLTRGMVLRGDLDARRQRLLILSLAQAIAPDEAAAIRRFVADGGTVIADVRPGVFDGHCKPIHPGALDDLFGVERTGDGTPRDFPLRGAATAAGKTVELNLTVRADADARPAKETAISTLLVRRAGRGRAILLNFQLPAIGSKSDDAESGQVYRLVRWLCDAAGVRAAVASSDPQGGPLPLVQTRTWQNGDAVIFGLWRQIAGDWFGPKSGAAAGPPVAAKVVLPSPRHVYDLRGGKYLGETAQLGASLRWGRASFFLASPYAIPRPEIWLFSAPPAGGEVLRATIYMKTPPGNHQRYAVWLEVIDPRGERPLWGRQAVVISDGVGRVEIAVAHNDLPGRWRLVATELFSRQSAEASWTVGNNDL